MFQSVDCRRVEYSDKGHEGIVILEFSKVFCNADEFREQLRSLS